ncbi:Amino acid/polyamine transporter I [Penicillium longicatenatum]|uniref:Amino acid/polyamine transporter I n=1 Tax=Penicillium longicatenatum TaxID=1561947 RepID=UPI0025487021|nr:Amino acid/polyamine transporter I [Penicillium longicatenatum]KAJ5651403.1 Amino acid/polyamine transporter I [Penicillium longicatenatum]
MATTEVTDGKVVMKGGATDEIDIERIATTGTEHHGESKEIQAADNAGFHRSLTRRKVMMMTFGAGIGTGLWVGTGQALYYAGPGGIALTYTLTAMVVYAQYCSIGEMMAYKPVHGGFIRTCIEYVDPAFGFAVGINFWFAWVMIIPAEITAAVSVLKFWPATDALPLAVYITIFLVVIALANLFHVRIYGYIEYYMSFFKCAAIILMICFLFIMTSGGIAATNGPIEFRYWKNPGAFKNGMKGIAKAFVQAAFSFGGGEHVAVIAGEIANPRHTIKKTVRPVFWRMFTFFIVNIWLVGMCVPSDDTSLATASGTLASPFVIAIKRADVYGLAHAINGFIFLSVISCGITSVYVASRSLTALADLNIIHPFFGRKDAQGRPLVAIAISLGLGGGLCYLNCDSIGTVVYNWFSSLVAIATLFEWSGCYISHLRFRQGLKAQGKDLKTLPFKSFFTPWAQYFSLILVVFIFGCEFYLSCWPFGEKGSAKTFFSTYLAAPLFVFDYCAYKFYFKTKIVKSTEMDFSAADYFDEEDRLNAMIPQEQKQAAKTGTTAWIKRVRYVIFG